MGVVTSYDRPVKATLLVRLDNGEEWEATPEDMAGFGYVDRLNAYGAFDDHLRNLLIREGLIERRTTEARLNPLRYIAELAICYPDLLAHPDMAENNAEVVAIERALQEREATS